MAKAKAKKPGMAAGRGLENDGRGLPCAVCPCRAFAKVRCDDCGTVLCGWCAHSNRDLDDPKVWCPGCYQRRLAARLG